MLPFRRLRLASLFFALVCPILVSWGAVSDAASGELTFTDEERAWLDAHPVIRVAPDPDYPPLEFRDEEGNVAGSAVDLLDLVMGRLEIRCEVVPCSSWSETLDKVRNREADLLPCAASTPGRKEYLQFTQPYLRVPDVIVVRRQVLGTVTMSDLTGKTVATLDGWAANDYMRAQYPEVRLKTVPDVKTALEEVSFGTVDAVAIALATASYWIERSGITNLRVAGETGFVYEFSFATRNDWPQLNSVLVKALASVSEEEKRAIQDKWVTLAVPPWRPSRGFVLGLSLCTVLLAVIAVLIWNRSLRRLVRRQTEALREELVERKCSEEELRRSEARYRLLFESNRDGLVLVALDGQIEDANPAYLEMLGYTLDEARKLRYQDLTPDEWADMEADIVENQVMVRGYSEVYEKEYIHKNGAVFPVDVMAWLIPDEQGEPQRIMGVVHDIAERREAERERQSHVTFLESLERINLAINRAATVEDMLSAALDEILDIFGVDRVFLLYPCDPDAKSYQARMSRLRAGCSYIYPPGSDIPVSPPLVPFFRDLLASEEALAWTWSPGECPWDPENTFGVLAQAALCIRPRIGSPWTLGVHQCSRTRTWTGEDLRLFTQIGRRIGDGLSSLLFLKDLQENEEKYRTLFETTRDGIALLTIDGHIEDANPAFLDMLGYTLEEIRTLHYRDFTPEEWWDVESGVVKEQLWMRGYSEVYEKAYIGKTGTVFPVECLVWLVRDEQGSPQRVMGVVRDITERQEAENDRRSHLRFLESLERVNRAIRNATDVEEMLVAVLDESLDILEVDRAFLLYPCDPDAELLHVRIDRCRPEYPGAFALGVDVPMVPPLAQNMRDLLATEDSVAMNWSPGECPWDPEDCFGVLAQVGVCVRPRIGPRWVFGIHQCSHERTWTTEDLRLFAQIGRRVSEGLSSLLFLENLRESEEKYRTLYDSATDGLLIYDWEEGIVSGNPAAIELFRCRDEKEFLGHSPGDISPKYQPDGRLSEEKAQAMMHIAMEKGSHFIEWTHKRIDGEEFFATVMLTRMQVGGRAVVQESVRDITEQKNAELALKQSEAKYRGVVDNTGAAIIHLSADGHIQFLNKAAKKGLRGKGDDLLGRSFYDVLPAVAEISRERLRSVLASGQRQVHEDRVRLPEGERTLVLAYQALQNAENEIHGIQILAQDITERREAVEEVRRLRNLLKNIVDSMPSVLVGVDQKGFVIQWNREAEKSTGISSEEAQGQALDEVFPELSEAMERVEEAIQTNQTQHQGRIAREVEGETRFHDLTVYPLVADGVEGAVIRLDDVTARVHIEEMMIQSEKMMSVGGLAAGMAHEINNPLAGILQNIQVVQNRISDGMAKNEQAALDCGTTMEAIRGYMERRGLFRMLDSVTESGHRAAKIVDNMLSFSRKSESKFAFRDVADLLDKTVDLAENDYDLKKRYDFRQIEIVRNYDPNTPKVPCEETKIQQVFLNVLKNGAEALADKAAAIREKGGAGSEQDGARFRPRFTLTVRPEDSMVCVEIADNGPGMPDIASKRVFEPFYTTKGVGLGTGLGLSVSYFIIVENHGGGMTAKSLPGQGTTFVIRLPRERSE